MFNSQQELENAIGDWILRDVSQEKMIQNLLIEGYTRRDASDAIDEVWERVRVGI